MGAAVAVEFPKGLPQQNGIHRFGFYHQTHHADIRLGA